MLFLPVVFYGKHGLQADVFETYMRRSGFPVQMVLAENGDFPSVVNRPDGIAVIALDAAGKGLELAEQIQMVTGGCARVFVLSEQSNLKSDDPTVEIIQKPFHLSQLIKRIQRVSRGN